MLFGIQELDGCASSIIDIGISDVDSEVLRLDSLIGSGLEPRIRHSLKLIESKSGRVLLIRVHKSWNGPHRVILKGHDKFYGRTSAGKYSLDVQQLRRSFTEAAAFTERMRAFRTDRLFEIIAGKPAIPMVDGSKFILHLMPFEAFTHEQSYDLSVVKNSNDFRPMNTSGWGNRITFEGIMAYSEVRETSSTYVHLYRNGIIEAVEGRILNHILPNGKNNLPSVAYERLLIETLPRYISLLNTIGVQAPIAVGLTMTNMRGAQLGINSFDSTDPILQDHLILPEMVFSALTESILETLRPTLDLVWNACGIEKSRNFNAEGKWFPPRGF